MWAKKRDQFISDVKTLMLCFCIGQHPIGGWPKQNAIFRVAEKTVMTKINKMGMKTDPFLRMSLTEVVFGRDTAVQKKVENKIYL
jgi:hypothetical protein